MNNPDPIWHQRISFLKSGFRIIAGMALVWGAIPDAGLFLIIAEVLGIIEELV
jgi:hypothetical protein